jgi:serine-type D-Ala-D-Ala carboxypeptidase (penicillin-binding protein 5/6)
MRRYKQRKRHFGAKFLSFVMLLVMVAALVNYARPLPKADASVVGLSSEINTVSLSWPTHGVAALGAQGFGLLAAHGSQQPRPTASMSKIITVLAVLEKHPLKLGQQGPTLTMGQSDMDLFNKYYAEGGSYAKVEIGEKITEYQMLQAILLPSANNMADGLAVWTFGSLPNYAAYANAMLKRLGLSTTHVGSDASGFLPDSTSTPADFIRLGELALDNPVMAQIVAQKSATIPVQGIIYSANSRLGYNNIIGIKTGLTDQAGGCFLFAARYDVPGSPKPVVIIGVIMGAQSLLEALNDSEPLLNSAKPYFTYKAPIKAGETFATLTTPWNGTSVDIVAKQDANMIAWAGKPLIPRVELAKIGGSMAAGAQVGDALISSGNNVAATPLVLKGAISGPSWQWRVKRLD